LHIVFDAAQQDRPEVLETVRFEGTPAEDNRQAATFQKVYFASDLYINGHDAALRRLENAFKMYEPDRFRLFADSIRQAGTRFLNAFTQQYKPNDLVQSWATFFINSDYYDYMTAYPGRHRKANVLKQNEWSVPISYYDYFKEHPYEIESGLHSAYAIGDFLDKYLAFMYAMVREELKGHEPEEAEQLWDSLVLNAIVTNTESNSLRENVLAFELALHFMEDDVETFEQYRSLIEANVQSAYVRIPLFEKYEATKKKVEKQIARDYSAVESLDRLLDGIIRRNRGKVTYVDIWATWCGPCIEEFPYSKKLQKGFSVDKVSFVYVCIESKQNSYEKALREFKLSGTHYLLDSDQSTELRKVLEIEGIPRYMLIDANGKLVSIRWRPSDDATKGEITKLIVGE
jgi:thiol-disulfide isomerase/thioredoxin